MTTIETIKDDFAFLDDWEDRYRYIIELGQGLPPFPEQSRDGAHKVPG
ncbi:SufE family protein, partial [Rhizobiaceae sp. 2RAB30]